MSIPVVLLLSAVGGIAIALSDRSEWSIWVLVACATALPAIAAVSALRKGRRLGGREGVPWLILAAAMTVMVPIYLAEFVEARTVEYVLIAAAYAIGGVAILTVPLPDAGPYQRTVASLDALGIGIAVATVTFWVVSGSEVDVTGQTPWVILDAAIIAMVGYVAVRRSQRRGLDWPLVWLLTGVGAYLAGALFSSIGAEPYFLGHRSDYAYFLGMASFAIAPRVEARRQEQPEDILKPVQWSHVLAPYVLVVVLAVALIAHLAAGRSEEPTRTVLELGILASMLVVLFRQLAMIAEQRRKIELEQHGVIATISHELRTPLTSVVGFLSVLEDWDQYSDDEKIAMVAMMRDQSQVLARVVGDLVAVARERIDSLDLTRTEIAVEEFLDAAIGLVPELHDVEVDKHTAGRSEFYADRERMLQIMANYLSNASRYGSDRVEIRVYDEAGETVIEVHDNGPGVPETYQLVIWERFERGPQRQSAIPGSGIGLSVARGIAHSHGGEVHYRKSERLGGACFSVRIPHRRAGLLPGRPATQSSSV